MAETRTICGYSSGHERRLNSDSPAGSQRVQICSTEHILVGGSFLRGMRDGRLRAGIRLARTQVCGHESRGSAWDAWCASWPGAQPPQPVIPDADRYIKLGTRLPELPPGEGGELRVVAPKEWCRDATYILEVRLRSGSVMRHRRRARG